MNKKTTLRTLCTLAFGSAAALSMALPKVLIVAAAATSSTDPHFLDVQSKLMASGKVESVEIFNAHLGTPTLNQLLGYDSVLVWSKETFANSVALGNVLADYSDLGGGVVTALYANGLADPNKRLMGRWTTAYEVIRAGQGVAEGSQSSLGNFIPCVWVAFNLNSVSGGSLSARPLGTPIPGQSAYTAATWSDGKQMAVQGMKQRRIDLGIYPPSSDVHPSYWNASTQAGLLMGNAMWGAGSVRLFPSTISTTQGTLFGGTFANLAQSDDQKLFILNDEADPNAVLNINGTLDTIFQFGTMRVDIESSSTRTDLLATVRLKNFTTNQYEQVGQFQPTFQDTRSTFLVGSSWSQFGKYLQSMRTVNAQVQWIPLTDLSSVDGWSESLDQFNVVMGLD